MGFIESQMKRRIEWRFMIDLPWMAAAEWARDDGDWARGVPVWARVIIELMVTTPIPDPFSRMVMRIVRFYVTRDLYCRKAYGSKM